MFNDNANTIIRKDEIENDRMNVDFDDESKGEHFSFEPNSYFATRNLEEIGEEDNSLVNTIYDKLEDYQNEFFNFRNKVNNTSHTVDNIDNMNQRIIAEIRGENQTNGKTIKDVYDSLFDKTMIDQNVDDVTKLSQYKTEANDGTCFTDDHWLYENDDVSNGGYFMDNVVGQNKISNMNCI
jgi:hypothetical protein